MKDKRGGAKSNIRIKNIKNKKGNILKNEDKKDDVVIFFID